MKILLICDSRAFPRPHPADACHEPEGSFPSLLAKVSNVNDCSLEVIKFGGIEAERAIAQANYYRFWDPDVIVLHVGLVSLAKGQSFVRLASAPFRKKYFNKHYTSGRLLGFLISSVRKAVDSVSTLARGVFVNILSRIYPSSTGKYINQIRLVSEFHLKHGRQPDVSAVKLAKSCLFLAGLFPASRLVFVEQCFALKTSSSIVDLSLLFGLSPMSRFEYVPVFDALSASGGYCLDNEHYTCRGHEIVASLIQNSIFRNYA
jgi:hypothetical protein